MIETHAPRTGANREFVGSISGLLCVGFILSSLAGCGGSPDSRVVAQVEPPRSAPSGSGQDLFAKSAVETTVTADDDKVKRVADEVSLAEQERRRTAQWLLSQADKLFAEADYSAAERAYRRALDADPSLQEAKGNLARCLMFLGRRDGEIRSILQQFGEEVKVLEQQRLSEATRFLAEGKKALEENRTDEALDLLQRARERLIWFEYGVDVTDLQAEAQALYDSARNLKISSDASSRVAKEEFALREAERLTTEAEKRRVERIVTLMDRIEDAMVREDFREAIQLSKTILQIDPENNAAKRLQDRAQEYMSAHRYLTYIDRETEQTTRVWEDLERSAIPYEDPFRFPESRDFWQTEVQRRLERLSTASLEESPEIRKIRRALASGSTSFDFPDATLAEVIDFLRSVSDLNITIDPEIDATDVPVNLSLEGVKLGEALDLIMKATGKAFTFRENILFITEPENAFGNLIFEIYNVTDVLNKIRDFPGPSIRVSSNDSSDEGGGDNPFDFGGFDEEEDAELTPDDLVELIQESTGGADLWDESGSTISGHKGQILVTATRELHLAINDFMTNLRANSDVFVVVEARFIDMVDDFLEDIGVDSRNLGQPPGQGFGTAYGTLNSTGTGGSDIGFNNLGDPTDPALIMGQDRTAGRMQHILDGFVGAARGDRLNSTLRGLTMQVTWLDPFQINAIIRASQEQRAARIVTAPKVTASNGQRVHVSVITQRSYVQDYELVSGGTGLVVSEVADPVIDTFQDGVVLDVRPVISADRRYITVDVRPTLASLINGVISTVTISLGTLNNAASLVEIDLPEISLQQAFTSVTVPDGGTVLLGGFRSLNELKYSSQVPILGNLPFIKNAFRRKAYLNEKRSLYILLTAKIVDLRSEERKLFN
ncbi:MAG: tetratricopeptide repeat protein [Planctomycetota bacterium]